MRRGALAWVLKCEVIFQIAKKIRANAQNPMTPIRISDRTQAGIPSSGGGGS